MTPIKSIAAVLTVFGASFLATDAQAGHCYSRPGNFQLHIGGGGVSVGVGRIGVYVPTTGYHSYQRYPYYHNVPRNYCPQNYYSPRTYPYVPPYNHDYRNYQPSYPRYQQPGNCGRRAPAHPHSYGHQMPQRNRYRDYEDYLEDLEDYYEDMEDYYDDLGNRQMERRYRDLRRQVQQERDRQFFRRR